MTQLRISNMNGALYFCLGLLLGASLKHQNNATMRVERINFCLRDSCNYDIVVDEVGLYIRSKNHNGVMIPKFSVLH